MNPSRREIRRYLGMQKAAPSAGTDELIEKAVRDLDAAVRPASVYRFFPLTWQDGFPVIDGRCMESHDLARNLDGCTKAVLMACTLGPEADMLVRRAEVRSMSEASVLQAVCTAMIEDVCDEVNEEIRRKAQEIGLYARPRYSPGYGDLLLETQKDVFALLQPQKQTGITLTAHLLMVPSKSVTAVIGLAEHPAECRTKTCRECTLAETCTYTKQEEV